MPEYGSRLYWDKRYTEADEAFDWMCDYDQLEPTLLPLLSKKVNSSFANNSTNSNSKSDCEKEKNDDIKILIVGCGNAPFSHDFTSRSGFKKKNIIHIDYCDVVIKQQKKKHPELDFRVMDALAMDFEDDEFDFIIDKSLIDTTLCYRDGYETTEQLFNELHRVLKPGGRIVTISLHTEDEVSEFKTSEDYDYEFIVSTCKLLNKRRQNEDIDVRCLYHTLAVFDKVTNLSTAEKEEILHWHSNPTFKSALTDEKYLSMVQKMFHQEEGRKDDDDGDYYFINEYEEQCTRDALPFKDKIGDRRQSHPTDEKEHLQQQKQQQEQQVESLSAKMEEATLKDGVKKVCE